MQHNQGQQQQHDSEAVWGSGSLMRAHVARLAAYHEACGRAQEDHLVRVFFLSLLFVLSLSLFFSLRFQ